MDDDATPSFSHLDFDSGEMEDLPPREFDPFRFDIYDSPAQTYALSGPLGEAILRRRRAAARFVFDNLNSVPYPEDIDQAKEFILMKCAIGLPEEFLTRMFEMHPFARVYLATQGIKSNEAKKALLDAVSLTFLGCPWPLEGETLDPEVPEDAKVIYGDPLTEFIPIDGFAAKLQRAAERFMHGQ
ncbi:hypothetical protein FY136_28530 (plasmid) [Agrobacterium tumefaciens]|uniref:hypothetical protein n=1 Tax=Agrobacterium tumefaciens TaxID=358 RepID=UPI0021CFFE83|nr:hypothetical protein [Agrobacterium tumefaciens]UXT53210.1 hypothetical protein FY136_28530 [Agrobacterium tumefaciens]